MKLLGCSRRPSPNRGSALKGNKARQSVYLDTLLKMWSLMEENTQTLANQIQRSTKKDTQGHTKGVQTLGRMKRSQG